MRVEFTTIGFDRSNKLRISFEVWSEGYARFLAQAFPPHELSLHAVSRDGLCPLELAVCSEASGASVPASWTFITCSFAGRLVPPWACRLFWSFWRKRSRLMNFHYMRFRRTAPWACQLTSLHAVVVYTGASRPRSFTIWKDNKAERLRQNSCKNSFHLHVSRWRRWTHEQLLKFVQFSYFRWR